MKECCFLSARAVFLQSGCFDQASLLALEARLDWGKLAQQEALTLLKCRVSERNVCINLHASAVVGSVEAFCGFD